MEDAMTLRELIDSMRANRCDNDTIAEYLPITYPPVDELADALRELGFDDQRIYDYLWHRCNTERVGFAVGRGPDGSMEFSEPGPCRIVQHPPRRDVQWTRRNGRTPHRALLGRARPRARQRRERHVARATSSASSGDDPSGGSDDGPLARHRRALRRGDLEGLLWCDHCGAILTEDGQCPDGLRP
jgi:hypothetical protein